MQNINTKNLTGKIKETVKTKLKLQENRET